MAARLVPATDLTIQRISSDGSGTPDLFTPTPIERQPPPGITLYVKIDLKIDGRAKQTAIFIPDGFSKGPDVDLVLFLHGLQQNDDVSISKYLQEDYGRLREGLNASGRNVILVAPTLGRQSQAGALTQTGGLDAFLTQSLSAIRTRGGTGWPDTLSLRNLIIACHSGGGVPEREIVDAGDRALTSLSECWGFESLYHDDDLRFWPAWARGHRDSRLLLFFRPHNSPDNAMMVHRCETLGALGLPNLIAMKSNAPDHMHVPVTHWQACLRSAPVLENRPSTPPVLEAESIPEAPRRIAMSKKPKAAPRTRSAAKPRAGAAASRKVPSKAGARSAASSRAPAIIFAAAASPRPEDVIPIPPTNTFNVGLSSASESTMLRLLGVPGEKTRDCSPAGDALRRRLSSRVNVGPFTVTGLKVAVDALKQVFEEAEEMIPNVVAAVKNDGMLCVRLKRNSKTSFSNHSWGTAIDLFFGARAVDQGVTKAARGCLQLAPFFNKHGWYWGAGFSGKSVDSMHFELAEETIKAALGA
jgi:hypothetical protein